MTKIVKNAVGIEQSRVLSVLHDAEENDELVLDALQRPDCDTYTAHVGERLIAVAVVARGGVGDAEILYLGVDGPFRRKGHGRELIEYIVTEIVDSGRRLIVGTGNSSLDNIAFYQRCGFRMDEVRRDYFDYVRPPVTEFGIQLRDMLVFAFDDSRHR